MKNQITVFLIMFGLLLWVIQVVNLNRGKENNVMYVEQGQEFYYGGLAIQADEFLLLDSDEYGTYFVFHLFMVWCMMWLIVRRLSVCD